MKRENRPSIGFVSTYPPTSCGIATFTAALREAIAEGRGSAQGLDVVSLVDARVDTAPPEVVYQHPTGDASSLHRAGEALNLSDVAVIQHEYGIYAGQDGAEVLELIAGLEIPSVVILHTVLHEPSERQRVILERLVEAADQAIVLSHSGFRRLIGGYEVDPAKVVVIPHGARASLSGPGPEPGSRPLVLTWGLIGPGKGLETALEAFAALVDIRPSPRYLILGKTHPKVRAVEGDAYLERLVARADALGLEDIVEFDGRYLDIDSLTSVIRQADIVLLPYESTEQVTSGVLVEALAAGKPVVATAFPHASELLTTGAGAVVPHSDPRALSESLRRVLTSPELSARMAGVAGTIGSSLLWPVVASNYEQVMTDVAGRHRRVTALRDPGGKRTGLDDLAKVG